MRKLNHSFWLFFGLIFSSSALCVDVEKDLLFKMVLKESIEFTLEASAALRVEGINNELLKAHTKLLEQMDIAEKALQKLSNSIEFDSRRRHIKSRINKLNIAIKNVKKWNGNYQALKANKLGLTKTMGVIKKIPIIDILFIAYDENQERKNLDQIVNDYPNIKPLVDEVSFGTELFDSISSFIVDKGFSLLGGVVSIGYDPYDSIELVHTEKELLNWLKAVSQPYLIKDMKPLYDLEKLTRAYNPEYLDPKIPTGVRQFLDLVDREAMVTSKEFINNYGFKQPIGQFSRVIDVSDIVTINIQNKGFNRNLRAYISSVNVANPFFDTFNVDSYKAILDYSNYLIKTPSNGYNSDNKPYWDLSITNNQVHAVQLSFSPPPRTGRTRSSPLDYRIKVFAEVQFEDINLTQCLLRQNWMQLSDIETLNCSGMGITSLKGIETLINLKYLSLDDNELSNIDLTNIPNLIELSISGNPISRIDTSKLEDLKVLKLNDTYMLDEIDLSSNILLEEVFLENNALTTLNVDNNIKLKVLSLSNDHPEGRNKFNVLNLDRNINLDIIALANTAITDISSFLGRENLLIDIIGNNSIPCEQIAKVINSVYIPDECQYQNNIILFTDYLEMIMPPTGTLLFEGSNYNITSNQDAYNYHNGTHYIVWSNGGYSNNALYNQYDNEVKLSKSVDGINWQTTVVANTAYGSFSHKLAVDNNGDIHVVFAERIDTGAYGNRGIRLVYANNTSGAYTTTTIENGYSYRFHNPSKLFFTPNGTLNLFYQKSGWWRYNAPLYERTFDGTNWSGASVVSNLSFGKGDPDDDENKLLAYEIINGKKVLYVSSGYWHLAYHGAIEYSGYIFKYTESGSGYVREQLPYTGTFFDFKSDNIVYASIDLKSIFFNGEKIHEFTNDEVIRSVNYDITSGYVAFNTGDAGYVLNVNNSFNRLEEYSDEYVFVKNGMLMRIKWKTNPKRFTIRSLPY